MNFPKKLGYNKSGLFIGNTQIFYAPADGQASFVVATLQLSPDLSLEIEFLNLDRFKNAEFAQSRIRSAIAHSAFYAIQNRVMLAALLQLEGVVYGYPHYLRIKSAYGFCLWHDRRRDGVGTISYHASKTFAKIKKKFPTGVLWKIL